MKKVNLLAAAVLAAAFAMPAQADYTPNAYFGGYIRSGVSNHHTMKDDPQVQRFGRLGYENDTYGEVVLGTDIAKVDDTVWSFQTRFTMKEAYNRDWQPTSAGDPEKTIFANREAFLSVKGFLDWDKDATIWAGKRFYREDINITDVYWYNNSGMGAGVENFQVGPGKASVAWFRRDDTADYKWDSSVVRTDGAKLSNLASVNIGDVRYIVPAWDGASFDLRATFYVPTRDTNEGVKKYQNAKDTYKGAQAYYVALNQGFSTGWNKTVVKYAHGTNANYGAFGNDQWLDRSGASNTAYRWSLYNFGDTKITDKFGFFHVIYATKAGGFDNNYDHTAINDGKVVHDYNKQSDKAFQLVVRPYLQLTKMTRLYAEAGFYVESTKKLATAKGVDGWAGSKTTTAQGQKYTLAYAICPDASNFWSRPEFRVYGSYVHGNAYGQDYSTYGNTGGTVEFANGYKKSYSGSNSHDFLFGVMAEAWW